MPVKSLVALLVISVLILGGATALEQTTREAGESTTITNESFTPSTDPVVLNHSERDVLYNQDVTVFNGSGDKVREGEDYDWIQENGTVRAIDGEDLNGSGTSNITYGFSEVSDTQRDQMQLMASVLDVEGLILIVLAVAVLAMGLRFLGGV